jgi:hypothetical protein
MTRDRATCDRCSNEANSYGPGYKFCREHFDEFWAERNKRLAEQTRAEGGPWPQRCPRRDEVFQQGGAPDATPDRWEYGHGIISGDGLCLTCNYCGSAHPDFFMEKIRDGWVWRGTDKNYKAYLDMPGGQSQVAKFYFQHLSDEQRQELVELVNAKRVQFGESGLYVLPFFMTRASL